MPRRNKLATLGEVAGLSNLTLVRQVKIVQPRRPRGAGKFRSHVITRFLKEIADLSLDVASVEPTSADVESSVYKLRQAERQSERLRCRAEKLPKLERVSILQVLSSADREVSKCWDAVLLEIL